MHKHILAVFALNEAEALCRVEPLDCTRFFHFADELLTECYHGHAAHTTITARAEPEPNRTAKSHRPIRVNAGAETVEEAHGKRKSDSRPGLPRADQKKADNL